MHFKALYVHLEQDFTITKASLFNNFLQYYAHENGAHVSTCWQQIDGKKTRLFRGLWDVTKYCSFFTSRFFRALLSNSAYTNGPLSFSFLPLSHRHYTDLTLYMIATSKPTANGQVLLNHSVGEDRGYGVVCCSHLLIRPCYRMHFLSAIARVQDEWRLPAQKALQLSSTTCSSGAKVTIRIDVI